jgi:XTP/dITP diphosphohydrolase
MGPLTLLFATHNLHKLEEVRQAAGEAFTLKSLADLDCLEEIPETGNTLEENAQIKSSYVFQRFGIPCFADDTGLEVEALDGEPGVYSARYAGPDKDSDRNMDLLLERLRRSVNRKARFRTVFAFTDQGGTVLFEGILNGQITFQRRGRHGFGYDPVFQPEGSAKTLAEMTLEEKNRISHRSQALRKLINYLHDHFQIRHAG